MKTGILLLAGAALGLMVGLEAPRFYRPPTLAQCLIDNMKGQPGPMFTTVYDFCKDERKAELTDKDVGIDDWQPAQKPKP